MSGHRLTNKEENFYSGTKQAVRALTEGLRSELRLAKSHIRVAVEYSIIIIHCHTSLKAIIVVFYFVIAFVLYAAVCQLA